MSFFSKIVVLIVLILNFSTLIVAEDMRPGNTQTPATPSALEQDEAIVGKLGKDKLNHTYRFEAEKGKEYSFQLDADEQLRESIRMKILDPERKPIQSQPKSALNKYLIKKFSPEKDGRYYLELSVGKKLPHVKIFGLEMREEDSG